MVVTSYTVVEAAVRDRQRPRKKNTESRRLSPAVTKTSPEGGKGEGPTGLATLMGNP
jgi:hypothetical protein